MLRGSVTRRELPWGTPSSREAVPGGAEGLNYCQRDMWMRDASLNGGLGSTRLVLQSLFNPKRLGSVGDNGLLSLGISSHH